jgi:hypothetical protein
MALGRRSPRELPCPTTRHSENGRVALAALTGSGRIMAEALPM